MGKAWLWAADSGGCGWYRTVIVAEALCRLGHDVGDGVFFDGDNYGDCDAVLGQRICVPGTSVAWSRWNYNGDKRTVFDADDDYFHLPEHPEFGMSAVEYGNSRIQARLLANAASSNYTTCASSVLADMFNQYCNNVVVVPNGLPERYLDRPAPWEHDEVRPNPTKPVVGWAGSSFTQWELTAGIKDMMSSIGDWGGQLHTIGVMRPDMVRHGLAKPGIQITGWIPDSASYLDAIDFDVWLAPYRSTNYNNAKAPTKALEAAFLGIPIVASDTTPYRGFVKDGVTGFLIPPGGDWETPVKELIHNPELRKQMGQAARVVARDFTIEKLAAQLWAPLLFGDLA